MTIQHKKLASGRWEKLSLSEQMANIGSEVGRAINWRKKKNYQYSKMAFFRALELLDLTIACRKNKKRLKELTRVREALVDDFVGENKFSSSDELWQKYFWAFNHSARLK